MAFQFPWTNLHELNLDWFLSKFKQFTDNYLGTTATAESVPYNTPPSVTVTGGELDDDTDIVDPFTFNFKIPAGQPGTPGTPGQDGFSPIATVTKTGTVATITITDEQGTTTATVSDGAGTTVDTYPVENSTNAVSSGGMYTVDEQIKSNLAYVQHNYKAIRAYLTGDKFIDPSGNLCMTTAYVAQNGTLTEGTNYNVINTSGGGFNNLTVLFNNANLHDNTFTYEAINIIRVGDMCCVSMKFTALSSGSNSKILYNLPKSVTGLGIPIYDTTAGSLVPGYIQSNANTSDVGMNSRTANHVYSATFAYVCNINNQYT